jgi:hypothetical protein
MWEIDTTKPKRQKHISRSLWRSIWKEPESHFPEEKPDYIPSGQWERIAAMPDGPSKGKILFDIELEWAESHAIHTRAQI